MKVEIPEFKKCCYCIPLRYGLLVWGYIKLVLTLIVFLFGSLALQMYIQLIFIVGYGIIPIILVGMTLLLFLMVDIGMTIVFIIGGHRKTSKLLRVFYIYSIVLLSIIAALLFISIVIDLSAGDSYDSSYDNYYRNRYHRNRAMSYGTLVLIKVIAGVFFLGVQAYIVLLIRSEINKLNNARNFRFTNIAAEAECAMENRNNEPGVETHVYKNGMEDREIGIDEQFDANFIKSIETKAGTFNYDKF